MNEQKHTRTFGSLAIRPVAAITILASVMLLVWACSRTSNKHNMPELPATAVTAPLDSLFTSIFDGNGPGAIIMVARGDSLVYRRAFGYADIESGTRISDSTVFNLSSASKVLSSVALLRLAEQGKINLDDSLSKYFPEFPERFFSHITIRHILTHSTGLPDLLPRNNDEWNIYLVDHKSIFGFGNDYRLYGSDKEYMQVFENLDSVDFEPGRHYQRNDPGYILLAPLIERVTGESFDKWMADNIFSPAGIHDIFYRNAGERTPAMAHGYRRCRPDSKLKSFRSSDGKWEEFDYGEAEFFLTKADRGAYSSARDYMNWVIALHNGKLINDSSLTALNTPYLATDAKDVYFGLGNGVKQKAGYPLKAYHKGINGGFSIIEGIWPESRLSYLVFSNRNDWNSDSVTETVDSIFKAKGWL